MHNEQIVKFHDTNTHLRAHNPRLHKGVCVCMCVCFALSVRCVCHMYSCCKFVKKCVYVRARGGARTRAILPSSASSACQAAQAHVNSWTCWPLIMWATKNGLDLSTLEFRPPFYLPKLVGFSAHAYSQNKEVFCNVKVCVLQCNTMKFSVSETWIAGLVDLLLSEQQRIDWIWVPWNLNPHFIYPN